MFEQLRDSMRGFTARLAPEERRRVAGSMREALVHAKLAMDELRDAIRKTEARLLAERAELETARRRGGLAAQIGDAETSAIAERFSLQHEERVRVLEAKLMVQQQELALGEREFDEMRDQMRMAMSGVAHSPDAAMRDIVDELDAFVERRPDAEHAGPDAGAGSDAGQRRRTRAEREADAEDKLAELKRRMGK